MVTSISWKFSIRLKHEFRILYQDMVGILESSLSSVTSVTFVTDLRIVGSYRRPSFLIKQYLRE